MVQNETKVTVAILTWTAAMVGCIVAGVLVHPILLGVVFGSAATVVLFRYVIRWATTGIISDSDERLERMRDQLQEQADDDLTTMPDRNS